MKANRQQMKVKLLDCTIRDGGYLNEWNFDFSFVYRLVRVLNESRVDYAEVGFWNPKYEGTNLWRHCTLETIRELDISGLNIRLALLIDFGSCAAVDIPDELIGEVGLLRIAAHKKDIGAAVDMASELKARGFGVTINAMGISSYSKEDILMLANEVARTEDICEYFYLADSFGALTPSDVSSFYHLFASTSRTPIGFHPHNNLELAVANSIAAVDAGAAIVDSSLMGIGRGGGNLRTELIAAVFSRFDGATVNPLPLLSYADSVFESIGESLNLTSDLEQVVSGMAGCHPNYATALTRRKRLAIDQIYRVIQSIPAVSKGMFCNEQLAQCIDSVHDNGASCDGADPSALATKGRTKAILVCPGFVDDLPVESANAAAFSVNHIPKAIKVEGAIFGNTRRLWQWGDRAKGVPVYYCGPDCALSSQPAHEVISSGALQDSGLGKVENSGVRAIALLLIAGYEFVDVYGMSGFAEANLSGDQAVLAKMDDEARAELALLRSSLPSGQCFKLHNSTLELI